jgi:hypothetical protein
LIKIHNTANPDNPVCRKINYRHHGFKYTPWTNEREALLQRLLNSLPSELGHHHWKYYKTLCSVVSSTYSHE